MSYHENYDQLVYDLVNFELLNRHFFDTFGTRCTAIKTHENARKV